jgi:Tfp pilus assembly protein PilV
VSPSVSLDSQASRRGATMLEMIATAVILGTVMTVSLPMLKSITSERRAAVSHEQAIMAAANIMERVTAMPFLEITPQIAKRTQLPDWLTEQLNDPVLELQVETIPDESAPDESAKLIRLKLEWQTSAGLKVAPIRLSAWVYDHEGQP